MMESFESLSGLSGLTGIGGLTPNTLPEVQYAQRAESFHSSGSGDVADLLVPDASCSLSLDEVPSFDLTDFAMSLPIKSGEQYRGLSAADLSIDPQAVMDAAQLLPATGDSVQPGRESLPNLPEPAASPDDGLGEELPEGWDDSMMEMTTPQLNKCIARRGLTKAQGKLIKACRRRLKNRCYAKISRKRRLQKQAALADDHQEVSSRSEALNHEVTQLRMANQVIQRRLEALTAMLVSNGKMSREEVSSFLEQQP